MSTTPTQPPTSLDKFRETMGISAVTCWRWRKAGWLKTVNLAGRQYVTQQSIAEFNRRAEAGEFAKVPNRPGVRKAA